MQALLSLLFYFLLPEYSPNNSVSEECSLFNWKEIFFHTIYFLVFFIENRIFPHRIHPSCILFLSTFPRPLPPHLSPRATALLCFPSESSILPSDNNQIWQSKIQYDKAKALIKTGQGSAVRGKSSKSRQESETLGGFFCPISQPLNGNFLLIVKVWLIA